ncbi:hypothetical protein ARMGADRAFT_1040156 [Armillaria gallica]|uniref:Retrotransposon gag domain-containing protein n=1 Tax=Armillaria gallica TaxID=47427 RepID=A0A2H3CB86_ARMGA|nr:hypothetical protein ARMGADRAFT_1040156 [Armillaria gallica]
MSSEPKFRICTRQLFCISLKLVKYSTKHCNLFYNLEDDSHLQPDLNSAQLLQKEQETAEHRALHEAEVAAGIVLLVTWKRIRKEPWDIEAEIEVNIAEAALECTRIERELHNASLEPIPLSSTFPGSTRPVSNFSSNSNSQPQQNHPPLQTLNMAAKRQMLMESLRDAPRLETLNPQAVLKHFRILEGMFKTHEGATTDDEKKDWAIHYTNTDIEDQWREFPIFESRKTWKEFKDKVMCSYDGAAEDDEDAHKGFLKVAHKYKREGIMDSADYLNYRQEFQAKTTATNPARNTHDPWVLEDVFDAGTWVLKGPGAVYNEIFDSALPVAPSTTKAEALSVPLNRGIITYKKKPVKAELPEEMNSFLAMMADSNRLIVKLLETSVLSQSKRDEELHKMLMQIKTQSKITQSAPIQSTRGQYGSNAPGNCHFCRLSLQVRDDYYQGTSSCTSNILPLLNLHIKAQP